MTYGEGLQMTTDRCGSDCGVCGRCGESRAISRRRVLGQLAAGALALSGAGAVLAACAPSAPITAADGLAGTETSGRAPTSYVLPSPDGLWQPPANAHVAGLPQAKGQVEIQDVGTYHFDPEEVETVRPDLFQPGHFSMFDVLVHLAERGEIEVDYHFEERMDTHVIDAINGQASWWYQAYYAAGWPEPSVFRMDMYPHKDGTRLRLIRRRPEHVAQFMATFEAEVARLARHDGQVVVPELKIDSPAGTWAFDDVEVVAHDVRTDVLRPCVVTALDHLLSLADRREFSALKLTWYERIGPADPVDSYWVEQVDDAVATGGCGFVYETGPREFGGFSGSHIHIPADVRVTVSPEYALWFWICLGRGA